METEELGRKEYGKSYFVGISDLLQENSCCAPPFSPSRFAEMKKEKDHKPEKEKESEQEVRDLPPKKDVKGGSSKENGHTPGRTGEVDFMRNYD